MKKIVTRRMAKYGCIILLIVFTTILVIAIQNSIRWLIIFSSIAIAIYLIGLGIVIYDYKKYG